GSIANQTKVYGADDPTLSGITVNLGGVVNNPALVTWNGTVSVNDTGNVATTLASLTRNAGEAVSGSPYNVTAGTFNALTGTAAGNYSAPSFTGTPTLTVTAANLTATVANQTKVYGADDPSLAGVGVTLGGLINNPAIVTWNGNVAIDDSALTSTATALTRTGGENVATSPYSILTGSFTTPSTNYSAPTLVAGSTLAITLAPLTATVANQTKVYGQDDPALAGVGVTLGGLINNPAIVTWNGNVAIDDSALTSTATALTRTGGENVATSPYSILTGSFTTPSTNYSAPTLVAGSTLAITLAPLTATVANQTKVYGQDDPALAGVGVTLGGLINNPAIVTWNGN